MCALATLEYISTSYFGVYDDDDPFITTNRHAYMHKAAKQDARAFQW